MNQENVELLLKRVENLGFSDQVKNEVVKSMQAEMRQFKAYETIMIDDHKMDYELHFSPGKGTHSDKIYLNEIDVLLQKAVEIKHTTINGIRTQAIEDFLQPIDPGAFPVEMAHEKELFQQDRMEQAQKTMRMLMIEDPVMFNSLRLKYNPKLDFPVLDYVEKQREAMQANLVKYNKFSTYFNLTALEMYNVMETRASLKTLYKTGRGSEEPKTENENSDQKAKSSSFRNWVKANFENRRSDGSAEIILIPQGRPIWEILKEYNFEETNDRLTRGDVVRFLEKGSQFIVTCGNEKLKIEADPEHNNIKLYQLNGEVIQSRKPYLKNQYSLEMGKAVEIKRADNPGEPLSANVQPVSQEEKLQQSDRFSKHRQNAVETAPDGGSEPKVKESNNQNKSNNGKAKLRGRKNNREIEEEGLKNGVRHT